MPAIPKAADAGTSVVQSPLSPPKAAQRLVRRHLPWPLREAGFPAWERKAPFSFLLTGALFSLRILRRGEMAERLIAAVLKTVEGNTSGGSNPSLSATI